MTVPRETQPASKAQRARGDVLLCHEDVLVRELLTWSLRRESFVVTACADGTGMASHLASCLLFGEPPGFDVVVTSLRLRGSTALEVLGAMHGCGGLPPVLLLTGSEMVDECDARTLGVASLLGNPFDIEDFLTEVEREIDASTSTRRGPGLAWWAQDLAVSAS